MIQNFIESNTANSVALVFGMILHLSGLYIAIRIDLHTDKKRKAVFIAIFLLLVSLIAQNVIEDMLAVRTEASPLRVYVSVYGYIVRTIILALFIFIIEFRRHYVAMAIIAFNTAVYAVTPFTGIAFKIDESNHFVPGPLRYCCLICSAALLGYLLFVSFKNYKPKRKSDTFLLVFNVAIIILGTYLDSKVGSQRQTVTFLTISMLIASALYYRWLHMQFVREHENDFAAEQRIKL